MNAADHIDSFIDRDKLEKQKAIAISILQNAQTVISAIKEMPKTGKRGRNIFIKTYNRRPDNKRKRRKIIARVAISTAISAMQIRAIASTPRRRYQADGIAAGRTAVIGEFFNEAEIIRPEDFNNLKPKLGKF